MIYVLVKSFMCVNVIWPEIHFLPVHMNGKMMLWIICYGKILKQMNQTLIFMLYVVYLIYSELKGPFLMHPFDNKLIPK